MTHNFVFIISLECIHKRGYFKNELKLIRIKFAVTKKMEKLCFGFTFRLTLHPSNFRWNMMEFSALDPENQFNFVNTNLSQTLAEPFSVNFN